jgi:hypothetical protein
MHPILVLNTLNGDFSPTSASTSVAALSRRAEERGMIAGRLFFFAEGESRQRALIETKGGRQDKTT